MGEKSKGNKSTDQLTATIARSRERIDCVPAKLRESYRERTMSWLAASTAVGALMILLLLREKKIYVDPKSGRKVNKKLVETGFALGALKISVSLVRPAIVELVKKRLRGASDHPRARSR
jgi:hypothetical protein